ncbi:type I 3-dehydroquinate dehydratase [Methanothermobacter thermautotrophicus]|jgi:3-dehydroquinate dehydratase-1|uniref:3-dehydroquinate dehydratase n=1 Tax=Methanothermobacter thermautotrophicus TaxID=145262 RepID=A0A842YT60_METTF|nr:type I 3-dehydroquinate dehydratase [Methanothermobacter thermautotrophicus]MBE2900805.1 type I 3-dehydroquinate dehydratase [Methanothermobacter thermautotrophicus]MCQ8904746.1 type I 3-dehydroquinate dehydratase [Methanothermobacter sp.]
MNTKICVPVFEKTPHEVTESAMRAIEAGADILEIRIDGLQEPGEINIRELIEDIGFPVIATNRSPAEGGHFSGSEDERIKLLMAAAEVADFVDIELSSAREDIERVTMNARRSIISYHNFRETPSLEALLRIVRMAREMGDMAKVAVMPENMADTLVVLQLLSLEDDTVAISMGELGRYTRVAAALFGSPITFASLGRGTAPGQMDVDVTRKMIRELMPED